MKGRQNLPSLRRDLRLLDFDVGACGEGGPCLGGKLDVLLACHRGACGARRYTNRARGEALGGLDVPLGELKMKHQLFGAGRFRLDVPPQGAVIHLPDKRKPEKLI